MVVMGGELEEPQEKADSGPPPWAAREAVLLALGLSGDGAGGEGPPALGAVVTGRL